MRFNDMKVSAQLVTIMLGLGLAAAIIVGGWSAWSAREALRTQIFDHLAAMRDQRAAAITEWYMKKPRDLETQAERNVVQKALAALNEWGNRIAGPNDPFPVALPEYKALADQLDTLKVFKEKYNYYDVFLVCVKHGHVLWSANRDSDLGANLAAGPLKDSGLAECWKGVLETKDVFLSQWKKYKPTGDKPAQFLGVPILQDGQITGVFIVELSNNRVNEIMADAVGMGQTGETNLWGADGLMYNTSRSGKAENKETMLEVKSDSAAFNAGLAGKTGVLAGKNYARKPVISAYAPIEPFPGHKWVCIASIHTSEAFAPVNRLLLTIIIAVIVLAVLVVIVALFTGRKIGAPLGRVAYAAQTMSEGDFTVDLHHNRSKDEIGMMTESFIEMKNKTRALIQQVAEAAVHVASSSEELSAGADETGKAIQQVTMTIQEVAKGAQDTMRNINQAQQNVDQTSKAIEGVSRDIEDVADYAMQAAAQGNEGKKSADVAVSIINRAADSVEKTTQVVHSLGDKTKQIGEFISIITGIADQTNLLALNAAIEAARAGEAGRGFAVVAEEVRKLAEESNSAAGNITKLVRSIEHEMQAALSAMEKSNQEVAVGASTVGQASAMLSEIVKGVEALTERVQAISAAAEQITASTGEVVNFMHSVAAVAEESAAASEEVSSAAEEQTASMEEISASAGTLARLAQDMQALVAKFKV
jgi:methyl-accepting chemotaxis protein